MERSASQKLLEWKNSENRLPLIIRGARQVGKTWLMREFGRKKFSQVAYVNFESSASLRNLFKSDYSIPRIISAIQIETGVQISAEDTLIVFDEIQESEGAITSLKYFTEEAPEYYIISAGSLLGIALHEKSSFPVGKVEFLDLFPFSFPEFLLATGQQGLMDLLTSLDWNLITAFKDKFIKCLREYYYVGGMPAAILSYSRQLDFIQIRQVQKGILAAYEQDFSKHAPYEIVPRIRMLWNSIPAQLTKENKKFIYSAVKTGSRAKDYELALSWLIDCGLAHKITRVTKPGIPLLAYEDPGAFKLFAVDTGLMAAMGDIDAKTLLLGNAIFEEFKGALTEQYVLQQLKTLSNIAVHYWSAEKASSEIDFLVQYSGNAIPIEVKAEENLKAKSLKTFNQKYPATKAIRTSMSDFRRENWLTNLPLYAINLLGEIV